jgi:hypothetical protein
VKRKGSSKTLIATGEMLSEITSKKEGQDMVKVGVIGRRAIIARYHEFGAPNADIPERSFIRSSWNSEKSNVENIIVRKVGKAMKEKI